MLWSYMKPFHVLLIPGFVNVSWPGLCGNRGLLVGALVHPAVYFDRDADTNADDSANDQQCDEDLDR